MRRARVLALVALSFFAVAPLYAQSKPLTVDQAKNHIGEKATVCGKVVSTHLDCRSRSRPTFLNLDKPYPHPIFTIVIWGKDRAKFKRPEERYREKHICVSGEIRAYRGEPEIIVTEPTQISIAGAEQSR